jgi:predicted ArsR family transcriptional regulator
MSATVLARKSDPGQSAAAGERAVAFSGSHRELILAALKKHGPMTAHELERYTGLNYVQIDRRMHELRAANEARAYVQYIDGCKVEIKRSTPSGGMAQVWEVIA